MSSYSSSPAAYRHQKPGYAPVADQLVPQYSGLDRILLPTSATYVSPARISADWGMLSPAKVYGSTPIPIDYDKRHNQSGIPGVHGFTPLSYFGTLNSGAWAGLNS